MFRKVFVLFLILALPGGPMAQSSTVSGVSDSLTTVNDKLAPALAAASGVGLDWSDAWIGYGFGVPPHFGIGITAGMVNIPTSALKPLTDAFGGSLPSSVGSMGLVLPIYNLNARIGGIGLPFDMGFKIGVIPADLFKSDVSFNYLLLGADVRYALIQDGILPGLSVGAGVNFMTVSVQAPVNGVGNTTFSATGVGGSNSVTLSQPTATLDITDLTCDLKAQISKNLIFVTPYLGGVMTISGETLKGTVKSTVTSNGSALNQSDINQLNNLTGGSFSSTGFSKTVSNSGVLGFKIYGGTSFNLTLLKLDLQALYNFPTGNFGLTLGGRIQL